GILGMVENGQRTLIIPVAYTQPLVAPENDEDLAMKQRMPKEALIAEVELQHISSDAVPPKKAKSVSEKPPEATGSSSEPEPGTETKKSKKRDSSKDKSDSGDADKTDGQ